MRRFFAEELDSGSEEITVTGEELRHLRQVLRITEGERVVLLNGRGIEARGTVLLVEKSCATIRIDDFIEVITESPIQITLLQALTKGTKPEIVIQKATELGASRIVIYNAERSVPKTDKGDGGVEEKRLPRWRKVAKEAAKQCGRSVIPSVDGIAAFDEVIKEARSGLRIFLHTGTVKRALKEVLSQTSPMMIKEGVYVLIGPEGGLTPEEVLKAEGAFFKGVTLGSRVLRSETAGITAVALLQYTLGDMG